MKMSQAKLKQLVRLLLEYEKDFMPDHATWNDRAPAVDESQPLYGEVIRLITAQVKREIE